MHYMVVWKLYAAFVDHEGVVQATSCWGGVHRRPHKEKSSMSFLDHLNPAKPGWGAKALEGVEYSAASYGYGLVQNQFREKASLMGAPVDLLTGLVLKAAGIAGVVVGKGKYKRGVLGFAAAHSNVIGNAGLGAFFHTLGAGKGGEKYAKKSGMVKLLVPASQVDKVKAAIPGTVFGAIPSAPHGDWLTHGDLKEMAR